MSETKPHQFRPPLYHNESARPSGKTSPRERGREQQGWEAYRKWLSTVSAKGSSERAPLDHSIYSWKGYHSWADKVKQSWNPDEN